MCGVTRGADAVTQYLLLVHKTPPIGRTDGCRKTHSLLGACRHFISRLVLQALAINVYEHVSLRVKFCIVTQKRAMLLMKRTVGNVGNIKQKGS